MSRGVIGTWVSRIVLGVSVVFTVVVLTALWVFTPPVNREALRRVRGGMTRAEVESLLGRPTYSDAERRNGKYARLLGWESVCVEFDERGYLSRIDHIR